MLNKYAWSKGKKEREREKEQKRKGSGGEAGGREGVGGRKEGKAEKRRKGKK